MKHVKLKWLVSASNAGEVIDKSYWGGGEESLYTCARDILRSDFNSFPKWKRTTADDLLLTRNGTPYIHIPVEGAIYSNVVQRISVPKIDKYYLRYALEDRVRSFKGYGVSIESLNYEMWSNLEVVLPDLATQRQIADFLDRETARIDLLIEKKQRLVALLGEKKETLRDTAVCKGLSDAADMKSSGVDWFGEVPSHWTVCRFNRLIASKIDYRGRTPEKVDDGVFLVTARNIRDGKIDYLRSEEYTTAEDWEKLSARGKPRLGDVIFTTEAPLGQIAQVDRTDVAFAQRIMKFQANDALISNDFLAEFMMTASFQRSLKLYSSGSTAAGIKSERLAHLSGLVPPKEEQSQIVAFVRRQMDQLNALEAPINASIDRLKEYRSALITAAVRGQIDVATYAKSGTPDAQLDAIQEEMQA